MGVIQRESGGLCARLWRTAGRDRYAHRGKRAVADELVLHSLLCAISRRVALPQPCIHPKPSWRLTGGSSALDLDLQLCDHGGRSGLRFTVLCFLRDYALYLACSPTLDAQLQNIVTPCHLPLLPIATVARAEACIAWTRLDSTAQLAHKPWTLPTHTIQSRLWAARQKSASRGQNTPRCPPGPAMIQTTRGEGSARGSRRISTPDSESR